MTDTQAREQAAPGAGTSSREVVSALRAARRVLGSAPVEEALREDPAAATRNLGLPVEAAPALLDLLNTAERRASPAPQHPAGEEDAERRPSRQGLREALLLQPFGQITWTFRLLTGMSLMMFGVGLAFLVAALVQSLTRQTVDATVLTLAGVGLADVALLFYRRPWEDITSGLSNSQQVRIIATTYLSGVSLLDRDDPQAQAALLELTRETVQLLEQFTEPGRGTGPTAGSAPAAGG